jgi:hypothetical protein
MPVAGITAEIGGSYGRPHPLGREKYYQFALGPRFVSRRYGRVTPFAQLLVGPFIATGTGPADVETALQPGAGIDISLRPRLGIRAGGDFRRVFADGEHADQFRFQIGVVLTSRLR